MCFYFFQVNKGEILNRNLFNNDDSLYGAPKFKR